jgi:hypothetical protein
MYLSGGNPLAPAVTVFYMHCILVAVFRMYLSSGIPHIQYNSCAIPPVPEWRSSACTFVPVFPIYLSFGISNVQLAGGIPHVPE